MPLAIAPSMNAGLNFAMTSTVFFEIALISL